MNITYFIIFPNPPEWNNIFYLCYLSNLFALLLSQLCVSCVLLWLAIKLVLIFCSVNCRLTTLPAKLEVEEQSWLKPF